MAAQAQCAAMIYGPLVVALGMYRCLNGVVVLRVRRLLGLAVPMGLSYLLHWWWAKLVQLPEDAKANAFQKLHKVYAERCFSVAVEFGGIWIKQGQKLSAAPLGLPVEYVDQLKKCTNAVPPRSTESIKECIAKSYGRSPDTVFSTFDEKPVGAASIGQVHRATLIDGREVVVKVQYPEVKETLHFDLSIMTWAMKIVALIQGGNHDKMMAEFKRIMLEELDFMNEVHNMDRIHTNLKHPFPEVNVPKPVNDLCTSTVLVMTIVPGVSLMDAALRMVQVLAKFCGMGDMKTEDMLQAVMKKASDKTPPANSAQAKAQAKAQELLKQMALDLYTRIPDEHKAEAVEKMFTAGRAAARFGSVLYNNSAAVKLFGWKPLEPVPTFDMSKVSQTIWDAFGHQVFVDGFCSADSHPGNILVDVSSGAVGLIDFGNAVEIPTGTRVRLARLLLAIAEGTDAEMAQALAQYGARTPNMTTKNFAFMAKVYFGDVGITEELMSIDMMKKTTEEEGGDLHYEDDKAMMVLLAISMIRISSMCLGTAKTHYPASVWTGLARQTIEEHGSDYPVGNHIEMDLKSVT
jgi:aarF domain-containing kinase